MTKASGPVSRCLLGKTAQMPTISPHQTVIPHMVETGKRADSYSSGTLNRVQLVPSLSLGCDGFLSLPLETGINFRYQGDELGGPSPLTSHNLIPKSLPLFFHQKPNPTFFQESSLTNPHKPFTRKMSSNSTCGCQNTAQLYLEDCLLLVRQKHDPPGTLVGFISNSTRFRKCPEEKFSTISLKEENRSFSQDC